MAVDYTKRDRPTEVQVPAARASAPPPPAPPATQTTPTPSSSSTTTWIADAARLLDAEDHSAAAYAGREATREPGAPAEAWMLLARANLGLGKLEDASYEAQRAVTMDDAVADHHFTLAQVCDAAGRLDQAISAYERAAAIEPESPFYPLAIADIHLRRGDHRRGLQLVQQTHERFPRSQITTDLYAKALVVVAEAVPRHKDHDSYLVTTPEEIRTMRAHLETAAALTCSVRETREDVAAIRKHLDRLETKQLSAPSWLRAFLNSGAEDGGGGAVLVLVISVVVMMLPLTLLLGGLGAMFSGDPAALWMLPLGAAFGYWWFRLAWVPRWKANARRVA